MQQENANVFCQHFSALYSREPTHHPSISDALDQLPTRVEMNDTPTYEKIRKVISQLNNSAAGTLGIQAEIIKALASDNDTFAIIQKHVHTFWKEEQQPSEFDIGKLGILLQKGALSQPVNYRGMMMLEVGQKAISDIIWMRLNPTGYG
eukprot:9822703-Ditylum_brightwellii.AAC.1